MPHFPIFTGNVKSTDVSKVKFLLEKLGNPQNDLKNVIHVVGTNGKGSSCAYLKYILREAGYKVCIFTSPHLHAVNERIELPNGQISDEKLFVFSEKIRFLCEEYKIYPTIFESLTIVAILAFVEAKADFYIFEAGMGGETDATNIFATESIASVLLTSLSLDHTKFLGETLPEIAHNKLGVAKPQKPLIMQAFSGEVLQVVLEKIAACNAKPLFFGRDYNFCKVEFECGSLGLEFTFNGKEPVILPLPPLLGEHQLYNLSAVLAIFYAMNLQIPEQALIKGILKTKWAGRLEKVLEEKFLKLLPEKSEIWFDGAHNEGGAKALTHWLESQPKTHANVLIISKTRGTEVIKFLKPFSLIVKFGIALEGKGEILPEFTSILQAGFDANKIECEKAKSIASAFEIIGNKFNSQVRVVVCGSLYLARDLSLQ